MINVENIYLKRAKMALLLGGLLLAPEEALAKKHVAEEPPEVKPETAMIERLNLTPDAQHPGFYRGSNPEFNGWYLPLEDKLLYVDDHNSVRPQTINYDQDPNTEVWTEADNAIMKEYTIKFLGLDNQSEDRWTRAGVKGYYEDLGDKLLFISADSASYPDQTLTYGTTDLVNDWHTAVTENYRENAIQQLDLEYSPIDSGYKREGDSALYRIKDNGDVERILPSGDTSIWHHETGSYRQPLPVSKPAAPKPIVPEVLYVPKGNWEGYHLALPGRLNSMCRARGCDYQPNARILTVLDSQERYKFLNNDYTSGLDIEADGSIYYSSNFDEISTLQEIYTGQGTIKLYDDCLLLTTTEGTKYLSYASDSWGPEALQNVKTVAEAKRSLSTFSDPETKNNISQDVLAETKYVAVEVYFPEQSAPNNYLVDISRFTHVEPVADEYDTPDNRQLTFTDSTEGFHQAREVINLLLFYSRLAQKLGNNIDPRIFSEKIKSLTARPLDSVPSVNLHGLFTGELSSFNDLRINDFFSDSDFNQTKIDLTIDLLFIDRVPLAAAEQLVPVKGLTRYKPGIYQQDLSALQVSPIGEAASSASLAGYYMPLPEGMFAANIMGCRLNQYDSMDHSQDPTIEQYQNYAVRMLDLIPVVGQENHYTGPDTNIDYIFATRGNTEQIIGNTARVISVGDVILKDKTQKRYQVWHPSTNQISDWVTYQ